MEFSTETLKRIVENGSPLHERLNGNFQRTAVAELSKTTQKRLADWTKLVAHNSPDLLRRRLEWDGLPENEVLAAMENPVWQAERPLPQWAAILQQAMQLAQTSSVEQLRQQCEPYLVADDPFPFEELLLPFLWVGCQMAQFSQPATAVFLPAAQKELGQQLLRQLARLAEQTFYLEFSIYRAQARYQPKSSGSSTHSLYQQFLNKLYSGGFVPFFEEYTVLARLMALTVEQWNQWFAELDGRLSQDWPTIASLFGQPTAQPKVAHVQSGLSDPHNNGRTVAIVTFENEFRLVYKPKDIGLEKAFSDLSSWLEAQGMPYASQSLRVIARPNYGWVEHVATAACADETAVVRYYQRVGSLLCLAYILEGTDCHGENFLAVGEYPVLIDVETFLHPRILPSSSEELTMGAQNLAHQQYMSSVLRTGMLPVWMFGQNGQSFDVSGLGAVAGQEIPYEYIGWQHINSDDMQSFKTIMVAQPGDSMPILNGESVSSEAYVPHIVDGFSQAYDFFFEHKNEAAFVDQLMQFFAARQGRFLFRNTMNYFLLLKKLLHPKYMRNGLDRSIQLDVLYRTAVTAKLKPDYWPLFLAEIQAMEQLDIPCFSTHSEESHVYAANQLVSADLFSQPGIQFLQDHVQNLSEADKQLQVGLIDSVFNLRFAPKEEANSQRPSVMVTAVEVQQVDKPALIQQAALEIADTIQKRAIVANNGSASWLGLEFMAESDRSLIQPLGHNLHSGNSGIAYFLAAVYATTGQNRYKESALAAMHQVRIAAQQNSNNLLAERMSLGAAIGLGSLMYTLTRVSRFLDVPELLDDAYLVAQFVTEARIKQDSKLDIMDGTAGVLLSLLALYDATNDPQILAQAMQCGDHLLALSEATPTGIVGWRTVNNQMLTGFSHGAAGIAYALLRLAKATGHETYLQAGAGAVAYESSLFDGEAQNWPDLLRSSPGKVVYGQTWCHGAPGIGLARAGMLAVYDDASVRQDIQTAVATTNNLFNQGLDTLCCGNAGRWDLLLKAGTTLPNAHHLIEEAQFQAWRIVRQRQEIGHYQLPHNMGPRGEMFQVGLFHGLSGIGYQLLRSSQPTLPSLLLWE